MQHSDWERDAVEFYSIYEQYYGRVRHFILTLVRDEWVADDLVQETFVRVEKHIGSLRDSAKLSAWIYRIAHNLCQDHLRGRKRSALENDESAVEKPTAPVFIQKRMEQHEMGACIRRYMAHLPASHYTVLALFDILEFSHREIADILDLTVENVRVRLHRARKKLRAILEENCIFEKDERDVLVCVPQSEG